MVVKLNFIHKRNDQLNNSRMARHKINEPLLFNYIKEVLTINNIDNFDMNIISNLYIKSIICIIRYFCILSLIYCRFCETI